MNFFDHKELGNHLLQLCPKVVKHPVYPHVLCLSKHHLRNQEISILCCRPYLLAAKYCQNINKSGGVCIYVHESLSFTTIDLDSYCKEHEFQVCAVKLCIMCITYCIITIYRSPTGKVPSRFCVT
jgi:hypothetical protein